METALVCAVEIQTRVADNTGRQALPFSSSDLHVATIGTSLCSDLPPIEYQLQIVHKCLCTGLRFTFYICALKAQVLHSVFIVVSHDLLDAAMTFMQEDGAQILEWAYKTPFVFPSFPSQKEVRLFSLRTYCGRPSMRTCWLTGRSIQQNYFAIHHSRFILLLRMALILSRNYTLW